MSRAQKVVDFIHQYCLVPEGEHVGKPLQLAPFQIDFIHAIYDNPSGTRRAYLSIARKNGKSGLIACLLLAHLVGPEAQQNSQIVSGAQSRDQAALIFDLARKMVMLNPKLSAVIKIIPSKKTLIGLLMGVEYKALAAEGKTAHGLSPVLAILDEVGQVRGPQDHFIDAITTSQGAHKQPLLVAISTQAAADDDLFSIWLDDADTGADPKTVVHLHAAEKDADVMDRAAWQAANPAMGLFRSIEDIEQQAEEASRMPTAENTFRLLCLNQRVSMVSPFVSRDVWMSCNAPPDPLQGRDVFVGLDLSARTDLTAAVVIAFDGETWDVWPLFWAPKKGIFDRAKRDRAPYDVWEKDGTLLTTPGASIDYGYVAVQLSKFLVDCNILAVGFDRWRIDVFKKACADEGVEFPLIEHGQGYRDMAPAVDALEADLLNGAMRHGGHPLLTWCAANTVILKDPAGNRKMDKAKSTGRIDGMVALAMARGIAAKLEQEQPSVYSSERGIEAW